MSYNGWHKQAPKFDKIRSVDVFEVELETSPRDGLAYWNISIATWLRHYVYYRILNEERTNSFVATMITNLFSGFWHGFYPIYYVTFFFVAIMVEISKDMYRKRHVFWFMPSFISTIILNILSVGALNYVAVGMLLLDLSRAWVYYRSFYFCGHILMIVLFILFRFVIKKPKKKD